MATKIIMPQLGESVVDGTVGEWLKQVGDTVDEYEPIVRVSTDKVDTEVPSPASGVLLAINITEGETVDSGVVLGVVGQPNEQPDAATESTSNGNGHHTTAEPVSSPVRTKRATSSNGGYTGHVTPVVARMADEHDLDLSQITGTGRNGRIRKKDVLAYLDAQPAETATKTAETVDDIPPWEQPASGNLFKPTVNYEEELEQAPSQPAADPNTQVQQPVQTEQPTSQEALQTSFNIPGEMKQLSQMRRSIAKHMVESKLHTSPHVTTVMEVDLHEVWEHRAANKANFAKQGIKLTFTPYFVMATCVALQQHPDLNARWTDDGLYVHHVCNIGMATAIDDGLIVPVIKNAQDYNLKGLARQVNDLADRARNRQLKPDEVRDGTFTITNHGVSGSLLATPIINQPQSAILGVGMIEKRVKVINDSIAIRPCAYLSLTFDHRVADGATADAFLMTVKQTLENWS